MSKNQTQAVGLLKSGGDSHQPRACELRYVVDYAEFERVDRTAKRGTVRFAVGTPGFDEKAQSNLGFFIFGILALPHSWHFD
jgi:hypothetical protein